MISVATSIALLATYAPPKVVFDTRFEPLANLTHQLDCVSHYYQHNRSESFEKLWKTKFLQTPEDEKALAKWKELRDSIEENGQEEGANFPLSPVMLQKSNEVKVRIAGFTAKTTTEYKGLVAKYVKPSQAEELTSVINHFMPRFQQWWEGEPVSKGTKFAADTQALLQSASVQEQVGRFIRFYQPKIKNNTVLPFHLIYKPRLVPEGSSGEQIADLSLMEFKPGENPRNRIDIALHELFHFFYSSGPADKHIRLQRDFLAIPDSAGIPIFNVMNEALATAFGNGMITQSMMDKSDFDNYRSQPLSWYGVPGIDNSAKASYDWLVGYLAKGGTLFDKGFAKSYTSAIRKELGANSDSPALALMCFTCLSADSWSAGLRGGLGGTFRASYSEYQTNTSVVPLIKDELKKKVSRSMVVLCKTSELNNTVEALELGWRGRDEILAHLKSNPAAAYGFRTKTGRLIFLLIGDDEKAIDQVAKQLSLYPKRLAGLLR